MSKTFTYTKVKERVYLQNTDEYEEYGEDVEYEPSYKDIEYALYNILYYNYFVDRHGSLSTQQLIRRGLEKLFAENDWLVEGLQEAYEPELYNFFEEYALEEQ